MLASGSRNQQCMCQVGLPGRLLLRCMEALSNEDHALHHPLQRTFERLSCQALTPADFRYVKSGVCACVRVCVCVCVCSIICMLMIINDFTRGFT